MRMPDRRMTPAAERFAERRRRENDAPKLRALVPSLQSLKVVIEERTGVGSTRHVKHVVLESAPALFLVPCGDPRCADGEHDLTMSLMRALEARRTSFQGHDECAGTLGTALCARVLHFDATAEYRT